MQDYGVTEKTKKELAQKSQKKKNDKYFKISVQIWVLQLA